MHTDDTTTGTATRGADSARDRLVHLADVSDDFKVADGYPDVRGWDVKTSDGQKIGEVDDLLVDTAAKRVRYLEVKVSKKALGTSDDRWHLFPIGAASLDDDSDEVRLRATTEDLRNLPVHDRDLSNRKDEELLRNRFSTIGSTAPRADAPTRDDEFYRGELYDERRFLGNRARSSGKATGSDAEEGYLVPVAIVEEVVVTAQPSDRGGARRR